MDLSKENLTDMLTVQGKTLIVPSFQRPYKWEQDNWNDLFCDIIRTYEKEIEHFMGAIVLQKRSGDENSIVVIDGQQRLTTITLCLLSFARWIREYNSGNVYLYNITIKNYIITNNKFDGSEIKRIALSNKQNNNKNYNEVIDSFYNPNQIPTHESDDENIFIEAYDYFYDQINEYYNGIREKVDINEFVQRFFAVISQKLRFIVISLDKTEDANMIFETLNTRGKALEHGELIRNYIFMHPKIKNAEQIYNNFWEPLEKYFEQLEEEKLSFSEFIKFFLYANKYDVRIIKNSHIYLEVKEYLDDYLIKNEIVDLLDLLKEYKEYFNYVIDPESIPSKVYSDKIVICLNLLRHLNLFVYTPIVLKLFEQHKQGNISTETLENIVLLIASYSVRLSLNGKKQPNKIIPEVILNITNFSDENAIIEDIEQVINRQKSSPFYDNDEFRKILVENQVYSTRKKNFVKYLLLLIFKNQTQNKLTYNSIEGLTLEHIFPQTYENWKGELNEDEIEKSIKLLNTIGNLTLINQGLNTVKADDKIPNIAGIKFPNLQ